MGDSADEKATKRAKVAEDEGSLEINNAVTVDYETKPLSEIATAPVTALQGVGPVTEEALKELGVETVTDLAENKCVTPHARSSSTCAFQSVLIISTGCIPCIWFQPAPSGLPSFEFESRATTGGHAFNSTQLRARQVD